MFAVSGWNVSAPLKTQTAAASAPSQPSKQNENGEGAPSSSSKKRKRGHGKSNGPAVTSQNVADMWEKVIEGKGDVKSQEKKKKRKKDKKRKTDDEATPSELSQPRELNNKPQPTHDTTSNLEKPKKHKHPLDPPTSTPTVLPQPPLTTAPPPSATTTPTTKLTPLQASMRAKLASARFRHLNETLYTKPSSHSLALFTESPDMFADYHAGFRQQVAVWPENPVDGYIEAVRRRGAVGVAEGKKSKSSKQSKEKRRDGEEGGKQEDAVAAGEATADAKDANALPLPRTRGTCTLADLGCGDARLATTLQPLLSILHLKIHSFDLQAPSPLATRADIANLPLPDASVDVAVFCLALMGTNWVDFVDEAWRVLRWKGELWVAEIKSRFGRVGKGSKGVVEHSVGKRVKSNAKTKEGERKKREDEEREHGETLKVEVDGEGRREETDVSAFVEVLRKRGFLLDERLGDNAVDLGNRMFVRMQFVKAVMPVRGKNVPVKKEGEGRETWKKKVKAKFIEDGEGEGEVDEAGVLKPCVYKLR